MINGERIRFGFKWSRYYPVDYEPHKQRFLRSACQPGTNVIDLGAHIGLYTVLMSRYVSTSGRVYAFEPTTRTRQALRRTVSLNGCRNVIVRPEAIGPTGGCRAFYDTGDPVSNVNSLVSPRSGCTVVKVEVIALDELGLTNVSCLKIDIEGGELDAMKGARRLIERCRPNMALEVHPSLLQAGGQSSAEVWDFLEDSGMIVRRDGGLLTREAFIATDCSFEVQVVPADRY